MRLRRSLPLAVALAGLLAGFAAAERPRVRVLADFEDAGANYSGGSHNALERAPSKVSLSRIPDGGGHALEVRGQHAPSGLAGVWLTFYDILAPRKQFLDASGDEYLTFRIRATGRAPRLRIKVADAAWAAREDAFDAGELTRFLPQDMTGEWQQVAIPLAGLPLDRKALAGVTLVVEGPGEFAFAVDDFALKREPQDALPPRAASEAPLPAPPRALWHWESAPHLEDPARWAEFLTFCRRQRIDRVWMQLPGDGEGGATAPAAPMAVPGPLRIGSSLASRLRSLLAEAHRAGIAIEVLDGFPEYALRENHAIPLATVDAVTTFNRGAPAAERIDGVHLDNEIHLLLGWHSARLRPALMVEFLEVHVEAQRRVRQAGGMRFGVDIPFWWAVPSEVAVDWGGARKPIAFHLVERLDTVGIMDYRDRAEGADGIIAHGIPMLAHADAVKGARVFVGVETFLPPPAPVWFAVGFPRAQFENALDGPARILARRSRLDGFRLRAFDDGERVHVGVELPAAPTADDEARATRTLMTIASSLGTSDGAEGSETVAAARQRALVKMRAPGTELIDAQPRDFVDRDSGIGVPGIAATSIMLPKVTFGDDPAANLQRELKAAEDGFRRYRSFAGMALHYYDTYRAKIEPRGVP